MRKIKYLLCTILILIAIIFDYELYQNYMYAFEDFYTTSFYKPQDMKVESMLKELTDQASKYQVKLFYIQNSSQGDFLTEITVYCDQEVREYLEKDYWIEAGVHKSLFSGTTKVSYCDFQKLSQQQIEQAPEAYYLLGEENNIYEYKGALVDTYGGSLPLKDGRDSRKDVCEEYLLLWAGVIVLILLFTQYQAKIIQKEIFIRMSLGTSKEMLVAENILLDAFVYITIFTAGEYMAKLFMGQRYLTAYAGISMGILVLLNSVLYLPLLRLKVKRGLANAKLSETMLQVNYIFKSLVTLLVSILLASNVELIEKYMQLEKQSSFYENLSEYSYVELMPEKDQEQEELETFFYYNYAEKFNIINIQSNVEYSEAGQDKSAVCINASMKEYVYSCIPELAGKLEDSENYLILPKDSGLSKEEISYLKNTCLSLSGREEGKVSIIKYSHKAKVNTLDVEEGYCIKKNPVILFSNRTSWEHLTELGQWIPELYLNQTFAKVNEQEMIDFSREHQCRYQLTNVYEDYKFKLQQVKRGAILDGILFLVVLCMEIILILAIIQMEFSTHRLEIVLKKLYGYSRFEQNRKLYITTIFFHIVTLTGLFLIEKLGNISISPLCYLVVILFLVMELILSTVKFQAEEKKNIQRVLKGGYL